MSLIGDALRKARQEAAERDLERKGLLFSAKIADRPVRSSLGLGIAIGAVVAIVATVAGGLVMWWVLGGPQVQDPPSSVGGAKTGTGAVAGAGTEAETGTRTEREPDEETATAPAATETGTDTDTDTAADAITATDTATDAVPESTTVPGPATHPASSVVTKPVTGFLGEEDGAEVYLMEAEVGSVTLSLDYLVFRESDPYVEINGTELHLGGIIEGFRVEAIERDRIRLSDGQRVIVLRTP